MAPYRVTGALSEAGHSAMVVVQNWIFAAS
jgi:hypothetical protein